MASNVSKAENYWSGWLPSDMAGMHIYVDGQNISISSWAAQYGSGSFAYYGSQPTIVNIGGISGNAFNISGNNSMMTKNIGDISASNFAFGALVYSNTAQDWKNPLALTRYFDPADRQVCRIETGGSATATYSDQSVSGASVSGNLNDSQWNFVSARGGGSAGTSLQKNGVIGTGGAYNQTNLFNRCNLGCNYKGNRHFTGVLGMAYFCTQDPGIYDIMRLEKFTADRLNITGRLSSSHWFKNYPLLTKRLFWNNEAFSSAA
ncbi:MAG: hypothetical protein ACYDEJ_03245 [Desulfitobacteriaceae bacterium]